MMMHMARSDARNRVWRMKFPIARRVTQIDEGRNSANCHSPRKSICVQLGRCIGNEIEFLKEEEGSVTEFG